MSLRFDHLMQNAASPASGSNFLAAAASFMSEYMSAAGALHDAPGGHTGGLSSLQNSVHKAAKPWDSSNRSKALSKKAKHRQQTPHAHGRKADGSVQPLCAQTKRVQLYRSYQLKFRQAWHDAKPGDLVSLESELRRELQDSALQTMVHRSIIGECLLDCLSMHYQMTKTYPPGQQHSLCHKSGVREPAQLTLDAYYTGIQFVKYSRGGKNGRCLYIPRRHADEIANPFRSNGSLMVFFLVHVLSRTPQLLPALPLALRQILFTCCVRTMFAECCAEEAHNAYEAAYCSLGRNLDSMLVLLLHLATLDPEACRKVAMKHRVPSAASDDGDDATFPTLCAVVEWLTTKAWTHPSTCCGGETTAENLPVDIVDGFQLSAAALLHALDMFPQHLVSPFKTDNLNTILDYFRAKPANGRVAEVVSCANCGAIQNELANNSSSSSNGNNDGSNGGTKGFVRCGGCLSVQYCSHACAKVDWTGEANGGGDHKRFCSRIIKDPPSNMVQTEL